MNDNNPRLGIDFGRVVMGAAAESGEADTAFLDGSHADAMRTSGSAGPARRRRCTAVNSASRT